ncbi:diguanylate cyclase [Pectinatus haikarae]|uniref:diguanylate cyclase n=1 Tax=Pectinatus haikarae TaxID=349096 RepID=UPI0018C5D08A|nr:diguanylate cyclase [Pectinatus haikarae]
MYVLHIGRDRLFSKKLQNLVVKSGFIYKYTVSLEDTCHEINKNNFYLIIIDRDVHTPYIVKMIRKNNFTAYNQIIVVSPDDDFNIKKYYFKLGIMAYFYKKNFDSNRFCNYLKTLNDEIKIITTLKSMKIAVVDDNPFALDVIKDFFLLHNIKNVDYYQNSLDFLREKQRFDLCFIDLVMPVYDGETLVRHTRETNKDTIIIIITGYNNEKNITHCLNIGADDFMLKPLDFTIFMSRINSCISRHKLNNDLQKDSEKLFELATRDALTNLYNRTYFLDAYKRKVAETLRTKEKFSLILLDIDHFKNINDEYGHLKGDYVLRETAALLERNLRQSDILCRWGGEEFIILLGHTDISKAAIVAENMRKIIENNALTGLRSITASFGVIEYSINISSKKNFTFLDNSLYLAKSIGRNKIICNGDLRLFNQEKISEIEWNPFFKSGNPIIDNDNSMLINMSNDLIKKCHFPDQFKDTALLKKIIFTVDAHFKREENIIKTIGYEKYEEHKSTHRSLVLNAIKMHDAVDNGSETMVNAIKYVIEEAIIGHVIKSDFDFFPLLRQ